MQILSCITHSRIFRIMFKNKLCNLYVEVNKFLKDELYDINDNEELTRRFADIIKLCKEAKSSYLITNNEKNYILAELRPIDDIDEFNIPYVNMMCAKFIKKYKAYYNLEDGSVDVIL